MVKTWMHSIDSNPQGVVDESATQEQVQQDQREDEWGEDIVHRLIPYKLVNKTINPDYQMITTQITGMIVIIKYMSPKSYTGKELELID